MRRSAGALAGASSPGWDGSTTTTPFWRRLTPGLAALEAALAGCSVLITPYGSTRDYFGDLVTYARPDRLEEIRCGLKRCWDDGPDPRLAPTIATHYLWPNVAQITAEVYDQVAR